MKFHEEVLARRQLELLKILGPFMTEHGYYLAGGTALALLLGHRESVDFDWFKSDAIPNPESSVADLQEYLKKAGIKLTKVNIAPGTIYGTAKNVRFSMMEFRYPMMRRLVHWGEMKCNIASLDDIACMKLSAVGTRGSRKDFVDIYALLEKHADLGPMLAMFKKKFPGHEFTHVLYGLAYFGDAEQQRMPKMIWPVTWETMRKRIAVSAKKVSLR